MFAVLESNKLLTKTPAVTNLRFNIRLNFAPRSTTFWNSYEPVEDIGPVVMSAWPAKSKLVILSKSAISSIKVVPCKTKPSKVES